MRRYYRRDKITPDQCSVIVPPAEIALLEGEIWKQLPVPYSWYAVSNLGRVMSVRRDEVIRRRPMTWWARIMGEYINCRGYRALELRKQRDGPKSTSRLTCMAHRIVAMAFIPNPGNRPEVNHINGIKCDNRVENLEWVTESENLIHAYATGLKRMPMGSNHPGAKINEEQAMEIYLWSGKYSEACKKFGVSLPTVEAIKSKRNWPHIHKSA